MKDSQIKNNKMSLTKLRRKYKVQLLLAYTPLIISLLVSYANVLPKYLIDYKVPMILILLLISVLYSYILLLKNHINDIELKLSEKLNQEPSIIEAQTEKMRPSEIHHRLHGLSEKEKELLRRFLQEDTRTLRLRFDNPIADGLRSMGILEVSSAVSTRNKFSYTINPIYWDHLKIRPDAIGL